MSNVVISLPQRPYLSDFIRFVVRRLVQCTAPENRFPFFATLVLLLAWCTASLRAYSPEGAAPAGIFYMFGLFAALLFFGRSKIFRLIVAAYALFIALYLPVAQIWGTVDANILSSFLGTNISESKEFLSLIPPKFYVLQLLFVALTLFLLVMTKKVACLQTVESGWRVFMKACVVIYIYIWKFVAGI